MDVKSTLSKYFNKQTAVSATLTLSNVAVAAFDLARGNMGWALVGAAVAVGAGYIWKLEVANQRPSNPLP